MRVPFLRKRFGGLLFLLGCLCYYYSLVKFSSQLLPHMRATPCQIMARK